jgi:xylulokinase
MKYTLGVDFGGSAAKATLLRGTGDVAADAEVEYRTYFPQNGWTEQDPEELYGAFRTIVRKIFVKSGITPELVEAIAVSSASMTGVYLDENDRIVRNSIYWTDTRSVGFSDDLKREYGSLIYGNATTFRRRPEPLPM